VVQMGAPRGFLEPHWPDPGFEAREKPQNSDFPVFLHRVM
jgi:hypothetical protein